MTNNNTDEKRLDWLDALRGWAVLGVVLVHTGQAMHSSSDGIIQMTSWGRYGVQLFFIVSAFTISKTYDSYVARYGRGFRTSFAWMLKRFFRIAPLYYFAILFYAAEQYTIYIGSHHKYGHPLNAISDVIANLAFVHTWVPSANNTVVPGGWSIGVETFFYLLVPMIWAISNKQFRAAILGLTVIPALLLSTWVSDLTTGTYSIGIDGFLYYWFPTQFPVLALGLIYYLVSMRPQHQPRSEWRAWLSFVGFLVFFFLALMCGTWKELAPVLSPTFVGIAFVSLIASLQSPMIKKTLINPWLAFLGRVSYSIYIFHFVVLDGYRTIFKGELNIAPPPYWVLLIFPVVVIIASGIACLSKRFIEDPGIKLGHRLSEAVAGERIPMMAAPDSP